MLCADHSGLQALKLMCSGSVANVTGGKVLNWCIGLTSGVVILGQSERVPSVA